MNMFVFVTLVMHVHFKREAWWAVPSSGRKCNRACEQGECDDQRENKHDFSLHINLQLVG